MVFKKVLDALRILFAKRHSRRDRTVERDMVDSPFSTNNANRIPDLIKDFHKRKYGYGKKKTKRTRKSSRKVKK